MLKLEKKLQLYYTVVLFSKMHSQSKTSFFETYCRHRNQNQCRECTASIRQEQLLDIIKVDQMEDREIIWVIGKQGNERKSWLKSYIQILYFVGKSSFSSF